MGKSIRHEFRLKNIDKQVAALITEVEIDKDQVSALLAKEIDADALVILTTVDQVFINYNQDNQQPLAKVSVNDLQSYIQDNQFAAGSMLPKIEACLSFVQGSKKRAYITSLKNLKNINETSTVIYDQ